MKRKMIFMALLLCGMLTACSQSKKAESKETGKEPKKVLVAYFSASGVTEGVAKLLAETTGGELHRIQPEQPYTEADLDWRDKKSRSTIEMADKTSRPAITDKLDGVDGFDIIYVGFPIWWYTCPTIVNTFMEAYDFKGKTVIPFATSGGSTIEKACNDLKAAYPEVNWREGKLLNHATKQDIEEWVKSLEL